MPQHKVKSLVFRKLTDADFFNINKPSGTEQKGGGQSYIDFSTSAVTIRDWQEFFRDAPKSPGRNGPGWKVEVRSLGVNKPPQTIVIQQRRNTSVSIRSQKLYSRESNRVFAWHPDITSFPRPENPSIRGHIYDLHIFILKLDNGEYWAGWFQKSKPEPSWSINMELNKMFVESEGYIRFHDDVLFDTNDSAWAFRITPESASHVTDIIVPIPQVEEEKSEKSLFDEDEGSIENAAPRIKEIIRKVRIRNHRAVKRLKELYNNQCQVSGEIFTFRKKDGSFYSEAHHLIPLGKGGADSAHNIVIVSPLIHRMFHHANVEGLDLKNIKDNKLLIKINGREYVINWHPKHAEIVKQFN